jgi:hypothetical protein
MAAQKSNFVDQIGRNAVPLLILGAGGIVIFKIVLPLLKGLKDTAAGASSLLNPFTDSEQDIKDQAAVNATKNEDFFDPDYLVQLMKKNQCLTLTTYGQKTYSKIIYDAKGVFNDNEEAIYGVFRTLKCKTQVSSLSKGFFDLYKVDLYGFLENVFNLNELGKISEICNKLPIGITDGKGNILK